MLRHDDFYSALHNRRDGNRETHAERRALADRAVHGNRAVVCFDNPMYHRQSQACAFAGLFGGKKGFENAIEHRFVDTGTRIADDQTRNTLIRYVVRATNAITAIGQCNFDDAVA